MQRLISRSLFALALLAASSLSTAAPLTIKQLLVVVGGQQFCDTTIACGNQVWNLNGGVTLTEGQTLILTQTGDPTQLGGENFDTSERGPTLIGCSNAGGTPCTVQIFIDSNNGLGLQLVNSDNGNLNPLSAFNLEPTSDVTTAAAKAYMEAETWLPAPAFTGSNYTLDLGYSDNIHSNPCPATGCFPQPVWCSVLGKMPTTSCPTAANFFVGAGVQQPPVLGSCGDVNHPIRDSEGKVVNCYDAGALRITAHPPSLAIDKTPKNGTFTAGSQVSYSIVVSNPTSNGSIAHNVQLSDALPGAGGLVWQTATTTQGSCVSPIVGNNLSCSLGDIPAGGSVTVTVTSTATTPPEACRDQPNPIARATDAEGDNVTSSGDLTCTPPPHITLVKLPDNATFNIGDTLSFSMTVTSDGAVGSTAHNVQILNDQIPTTGGLTWTVDAANTTFPGCSVNASQILNCVGPLNLAVGTSAKVTVKTTNAAGAPAGSCTGMKLINNATATSSDAGMSTDPGDYTCQAPRITLVKTPDNATFNIGDTLFFDMVVTNVGPAGSTAHNVQILNDQIPTTGGLTWTVDAANTTFPGCSVNASQILNCVGPLNLASGASAKVRVKTTNAAGAPAGSCTGMKLLNDATATSSDAGSSRDTGDYTCQPPHITLVKTPDNATFNVGDTLSFVMTVTSDGAVGSTAHNVQILNDQIPTTGGLTWTVDAANTTFPGCSVNASQVLNCVGPLNLAQGSSVKVTVKTTNAAGAPPGSCTGSKLVNTATATSSDAGSSTDPGDYTCMGVGKSISIGPSSMEGAIKIDNGDWVNGGYSFKTNFTGTITITATVSITGPCSNGGTDTLVVPLGSRTYSAAAGSDWKPTGDQNSILSWQGSVIASVCGGVGQLNASKGAVYNATISGAPAGGKVTFRFKFRDPAAKGKPNTNCLDASDPNRNKADVCGASWSETKTDP